MLWPINTKNSVIETLQRNWRISSKKWRVSWKKSRKLKKFMKLSIFKHTHKTKSNKHRKLLTSNDPTTKFHGSNGPCFEYEFGIGLKLIMLPLFHFSSSSKISVLCRNTPRRQWSRATSIWWQILYKAFQDKFKCSLAMSITSNRLPCTSLIMYNWWLCEG